MAIVGNLSEFPLPEVLLLIGSRTGCLRIYDVPELMPMELDLSEGQTHALRINEYFLTRPAQIVAELSLVVESGEGTFEFFARPIESVEREDLFPVSQMVMSLVLHVDEKLARQRALMAPQLFYLLEIPAPQVWLEPGLNQFFQQSRQLLAGGVRAEDLAEFLGEGEEAVRRNLNNLRMLGITKLLETSDVETLRETLLGEEITQKNNEYQFAAEASEILRRSGKLLKLPA
jgi:hypothetical protein